MNESIKEYWNELNEMYGLNLEMPEELKSAHGVQFDMAMGKTFDSAMQNNMGDE